MNYKKLTYCDTHDGAIVSFQHMYGESAACPLCEALKKVEELEEKVEELTDSLEEARQEE